MRRGLLIIFALTAICTGLFSQPQGDRKLVDFTADLMRPIKIGDSSVMNLIGNVVFYHNGAIITCDSAVRYNDKRMECFINVVINKQSTYVYGDRADYNGDINLAKVYAPIIKMVDKDATLYTYNFAFNTLSNVGKFSGGGTMKQKENLLESNHGYYYADMRDIVCVGDVEIQSPDYKIKSDSVGYNMDSEVAKFFVKTLIWNSKGEILSADRGLYKQQTSEYEFTKNSYILTANKELWSDSLDYNSVSENAILHRNIQLRDEEQKVMGFGDFGQYWGNPGDAVLTQNPSMVSFDPEQDTLYMRSDSMFLYTVSRNFAIKSDSVAKVDTGEEEIIMESPTPKEKALEQGEQKSGLEIEQEDVVASETTPTPSTLSVEQSMDSGGDPPLTKQQKKAKRQKEKELQKAAENAAKGNIITPKNDSKPSGENPDSVVVKSDNTTPSAKNTEEKSHLNKADSAAHKADSAALNLIKKDSTSTDSISISQQLLTPEQLEVDSALLAAPENADTLQRIMKAYRNVRIFRNDFQAVCDSLVGFSIDSTLHLYIKPVLWNENNQITSEVIDLYTKNQELYKAIFTGAPMMCAEVDTLHYNQVKGKIMEAFFRENAIYRTDVNGNGQTFYYMVDDNTAEITGFLTVECADITFIIGAEQVEQIIYRTDPVYSIYPMDKIPVDQPMFLDGFQWEIKRKPTLADVFTRTIRPSRRAEYEALPQPTYPLTKSIKANIKEMISRDVWRERNDVISQSTREYVNSLGY